MATAPLPSCNSGVFPRHVQTGRALLLLWFLVQVTCGRADVLELDGYGSYVELPAGLGADLEEFTLELRVRWDHLGYFDAPLHFGDTRHAVAFNHQARGFRTPVFFVQPGTPAPLKAVAGPLLEPGRWVHLAATVGAQGIRLYANGTCVATNAAPVPPGLLRHSPLRWLGRSPWPDNGYFRGALDDVCLWNRVLTADALRSRCQTVIAGTEEGLVAAWTFEPRVEPGKDSTVRSVGQERQPARLHAGARIVPEHPLHPASFPAPAILDGIASSESGPCEAGRARLWREDALLQEVATGPRGVFHFDVVSPPGVMELEVIQGTLGARQRIEMTSGSRQSLPISLRPCRSVTGRVTTLNGVPQPGAEVVALRQLDADPGGRREQWSGGVRTDTSGRYQFLNLREGRYRIVCRAASDSLLSTPASDPEFHCQVRTGAVAEPPDFRIPRLHSGHAWRPLGREDGLPEQEVTAIAADPEGNVWLGTSGGLSRYDGSTLAATWRRKDGLPSDQVTALAPGGDQDLWVGTTTGLARMMSGRLHPAPGSHPPKGRIHALTVDHRRDLWVGSEVGIHRWDGVQWVHFDTGAGLPSRLVRALKTLPDGTVLAWTDGGRIRWTGGRWTLHDAGASLPGLPDGRQEGEDSEPRDNPFEPTDWQATAVGELWAIASGRLHRFNGRAWSDYGLNRDDIGFGPVLSMATDSRRTLWIGTSGKGAWRRVEERVGQLNEADGLPGRAVRATERGADGSLWIGTDEGIARWRQGNLETWSTARGIRCLKVDRAGRLWIGTDSGVLWLDGDQFQPVPGSPGNRIASISEGPDGSVWLATGGDGIIRWSSREGFHRPATDRGVWEGWLTSILAARDGTIWYAQDFYLGRVTPTETLRMFLAPDGATPEQLHVTSAPLDAPMEPKFHLPTTVVVEGPDGTIWAGTLSRGLLRC
ncbi:MAG: carboxypeptidase regulatory-like domain-containing protein [Verrucomicrobia bacterium]|nr:carboxypeptidase regulatory-like domain-containing protein [Verrucomicrobiota bacterium]